MSKRPPNRYTTLAFWEKKVEAIEDLIDENDRMIAYWRNPAQGKTDYAYAKQQIMTAMKFKLHDELNMARLIVNRLKAETAPPPPKQKRRATNYFGLSEGPKDQLHPVDPDQRQG